MENWVRLWFYASKIQLWKCMKGVLARLNRKTTSLRWGKLRLGTQFKAPGGRFRPENDISLICCIFYSPGINKNFNWAIQLNWVVSRYLLFVNCIDASDWLTNSIAWGTEIHTVIESPWSTTSLCCAKRQKKTLNFPFCAYLIGIICLLMLADRRTYSNEYMYFHRLYAGTQALAQRRLNKTSALRW